MCCLGYYKKSLKLPKGGSEPVNRQITHWPKEKGITDVRHKTTGRATVHLNNNRGELRISGRVNSFLLCKARVYRLKCMPYKIKKIR